MTCQSCGVEIADKAIVCYRCGAPTAVAPAPRTVRPAGRRRWRVVAGGIVALGVWLAVPGPAMSPVRAAAGLGAGALVVVIVMRVWRR